MKKKKRKTKTTLETTLELINELYDYSKSLDFLPPRGDGAKMEVAKEIHQVVLKLFRKSEDKNTTEKENYEIQLTLLELVEQILLDKIDNELTVEELWELDDVGYFDYE